MRVPSISGLLHKRDRGRGMRAGLALPFAAALLSVGVGVGVVGLAAPAGAATAAGGTSIGHLTQQAPASGATVGHQSKTAPTPALRPQLGGLPGSALSTRFEWCGISGDFQLNLGGLGVYNGQAVAVSIAEAGDGGSEFFGSARMHVNNVAVWNGNVTIWVTVEWPSGLCIWAHYVSAG